MSIPLLSRAAALFLSLAVSPVLLACPQGQHEVCIADCVCVPDPGPIFGDIQENMGRMAASALETWLIQSRETALREGSEPIPADIREQMRPYFSEQVLDAARFKVGEGDELNIGAAVMHNQDTEAVTLVDVIVFRSLNDAMENLPLWAHELKHVEQYQQWGVKEFATRYSRDFDAVESPAYEMQTRVTRALQAKK
ncbi:eCIS core domain-containing protein [Pseudomonas jinjuensis]|uniref:eCIS core domain-containing protein n=1 Tax=Pseudomonas jinjuensis TaxID=198616 RepID=A0A1H0LCL8_9PSED|nr:DUF4157 domain-containing protein [Pseudomonas jinjuensis]SDO65984.1 protein of unknown function [Pseudomonas jinjuensis]